jgi:signal transduction histidine kinase
MPILRNPARRPARATSVVALLVVALVVVGILTYQAVAAARSHRAAAEAALGDYAAFAAWEYSRLANADVMWALWDLGKVVYYMPPPVDGRLPTRADLAGQYAKVGTCDCPYLPRLWFALDLETGQLNVSAPDVDPALAAWIRDSVRYHAHNVWERDKWEQALLVAHVGRSRRAVVYVLKKTPEGNPRAAYGYELGLGIVQSALRRRFERSALLPPQVAGVERNDSLLSVLVEDRNGSELFRSQPYFASRFVGSDTLESSLAGLKVTVTIHPEAAGELVIGGLPRSRMPLLLGLLALTVGLVVIALVQLRREYELARVRQDFVSGVSHELRTPLAQIRMFVETLLLERVRSPEEGRKALDIISREAQRLTHLVENVLQFSRAERGTMQLSPEPARLDHLIGDLLESFQPLARSRDVTLRSDLEAGVTATVDAAVRVGLTLEHGAARMSVEDEGPGIPADNREQVWEPFWRLARDSQSAVGGSGIGLAVVRELVLLHDGTARIDAGAAGGARFVISIPGAARSRTSRPVSQPAGVDG